MSRYKNILQTNTAKENIPAIPVISERESDIYFQFNESDRLDLVSHRIYGDSQYWWVILSANNYLMEFDIEPGELLRVPYPLIDVLNEIRQDTQ